MIQVLFYVFALAAIAFSVMVIAMRNPMHSALSLFGFFWVVAGIFILLNAEFVAIVQLFVYAGGILVLYLFVVMFMHLDEAELAKRRFHKQKAAAILCTALLLGGFVIKVIPVVRLGEAQRYTPEVIKDMGGGVNAVGSVLLTEYIVPFEITSIILLVAMVGAVIFSRGMKKRSSDSEEAHQ